MKTRLWLVFAPRSARLKELKAQSVIATPNDYEAAQVKKAPAPPAYRAYVKVGVLSAMKYCGIYASEARFQISRPHLFASLYVIPVPLA